jgi:hypothetical protein
MQVEDAPDVASTERLFRGLFPSFVVLERLLQTERQKVSLLAG